MIFLSTHKTPVLTDIFGVSEFKTSEARLKEFVRLSVLAKNCGLFQDSFKWPYMVFHSYVKCGYLSPQSASYFITGRATPQMWQVLEEFRDFLSSKLCQNPLTVLELWQKVVKVDENTSLFPLVELDCSF